MLSDVWNELYFWSEYGETRANLPQSWLEQAGGDEKALIKELDLVNRVTIEAGSDLSEDDWVDLAKKAKNLFGNQTVLDIGIRRSLIGGGRVIVNGNIHDNTVINRFKKWRNYE